MKTLANALFVPPTGFVAAMVDLARLHDPDIDGEGECGRAAQDAASARDERDDHGETT